MDEAVAGFLNSFGVAYGSTSEVRAWHAGLDAPRILARRGKSSSLDNEVTAVFWLEERLFDAGYDGAVRETITGSVVGSPQAYPIIRLAGLEGRLIAAVGDPVSLRARIYDVKSNSVISELDDTPHGGLSIKHLCDLDLAVAGKTIYVASQNVVSINGDNGESKVRPVSGLPPFHGFFPIKLLSDGENAYAMALQRKGVEVRPLANPSAFAFWKPDRNWYYQEKQQSFLSQAGSMIRDAFSNSYGYPEMVAISDGVVVLGLTDSKAENAWISVFPFPQLGQGRIDVKPQTLVRNAFEFTDDHIHGYGNPLAIVPRKDLDKLIAISLSGF